MFQGSFFLNTDFIDVHKSLSKEKGRIQKEESVFIKKKKNNK